MLTDTKIRNLKPAQAKHRTADTDGLYIEVMPSGKKRWVFRYTDDRGKRHWKTLGEFPMVDLREARELRDQKRRMLFDGVPLEEEQGTDAEEPEVVHTFRDIAMEWHEKNLHKWSGDHDRLPIRRLELHAFPVIGSRDIRTIRTKDLLEIAQQLEQERHVDTARRVMQICARVFRYAVSRGHCENDPAYALQGSISEIRPKHYASLTDPNDIAVLLRNIDAYPQPTVRRAMQFSALTFLRPGEVRHAEWKEIDIDRKEMRIPAEKMKRESGLTSSRWRSRRSGSSKTCVGPPATVAISSPTRARS